MPTYSKETALYDTGKIATDITGAGETASKYITAIDNNGIKVHAENNPTTNYTKIDANGMEVYQKVNDTATKVASFGKDGAQIGQDGSCNILMRSNSLKLRMALITLTELTGTAFKFYDPVTHEERLMINADGIYLKGKLITGTYSYARLQAEYFLIAYYNGNRHITSEYFGKGGFGNYLFSRKQIAKVGSHPIFSSTVVDEDGLKIIHDDSDTPYDTPLTGSFNTTSASLEDDTLLLQNVNDYGNEYQTVEVSAEDDGGIVITAKDEDGNQNEIFKLEGTYDMQDASNSHADMTLIGELTASNIGAKNWVAPSAVSCQTGKWYKVAEVTLDPGIWFIDCNAYFPKKNTTGTRQIRVTTDTFTNGTTTMPGAYGNIGIDVQMGVNEVQYPQAHFPVDISSQTTFRLAAYQGSGSTISVTGRMYATRIK